MKETIEAEKSSGFRLRTRSSRVFVSPAKQGKGEDCNAVMRERGSMRKRVLVMVALVLVSVPVLAGTYLMNDTGQTAYALTGKFSEPVTITAFGDALTKIDPTGQATQFTLSGGEVSTSSGEWLNWEPASAKLVGHDWIMSEAELHASVSAGIPVEKSSTGESPIVTGELLNPLYFAHGAYVMQGVDDHDKIFAMPLLGVPKLSFFPTAAGVDPSTVTWNLKISNPEGIEAEIENDTVYIWGSDASWSGYGEVTLTATASGVLGGTVIIPVTVFQKDKTLFNAEGKKDYFIPWSSKLDINRILSVEEHMRTYDKSVDNLDLTVQWSNWRRMTQMRAMSCGTQWLNEHTTPGWTT